MRTFNGCGIAIVAAIAGLLPATLEAAVQTQTRTTAATVTPTGGWGSPGNAASINSACALGDGSTSGAIAMTNWSFAIPAGATILGITVRSVSSFNDVSTQDQISLTKSGASVGSSKILNGPGTTNVPSCGSPIGGASGLTVGGAADLWGTTWTVAEINATGFGVFYDNDFFNTAVDGVEITVTYDDGVPAGPTVTINQAGSQSDPATTSPINFTVVFSAPVTGFTGSDLQFTGSTAPGTLAATVTGGPTNYNVAVAGMTGSGTVIAIVPAGVATDGANTNQASTSTDNTVTFSPPVPTVTIDQALGQSDPATSAPINFTVVFSTAVTGFTNADVSLATSTAPGTLTALVSGGPTTYNVAVSGMTGSGTVVASVPAGVATDGFNTNAASTSTDNTVQLNVVPLTVTIDQALSQVDPAVSAPINFTVVFSSAVTGFTNADVSLATSTAPGTLTALVSGGPTTYNVAVSGMTGSGNVVAIVPAGVATDGINTNAASTSTDNTVFFAVAVPLMPWPMWLALVALVGGVAAMRLRRRAVV